MFARSMSGANASPTGRSHQVIDRACSERRSIYPRQVASRVHRLFVQPHFVVEVRSGSAARHSHPANNFPFAHGLSGMDGEAVQMGKSGRESIAVIDHNEVAIVRLPLSDFYNALGRRFNRTSDRSLNVETHVHLRRAIEWVEPDP